MAETTVGIRTVPAQARERQMSQAVERRRHARQAVARPCKIRSRTSGRYLAGLTRDVSDGGVAIEIRFTRPLSVGDEIEVVIDWTGSAVLSSDALTRGRIVRADPTRDGLQRVAVELARAGALRKVA